MTERSESNQNTWNNPRLEERTVLFHTLQELLSLISTFKDEKTDNASVYFLLFLYNKTKLPFFPPYTWKYNALLHYIELVEQPEHKR